MTETENLRRLARYNAWATKVIYDAVAALPESEATKERPTLFKNMVRTLGHLYTTDVIWQAHLQGREHGIPALNHVIHAEFDALWFAQQEMDAWYINWADTLTEAKADEVVEFTLIGGNQGAMRRADIFMHVVTHSSYHRGWAADLFFQVPSRPPTMDLPVFLRLKAEGKA